MKSKTGTRILWGTLVTLVLSLAMWSGVHAFLRHGSILLGIEPRYEGQTLGYWCEHTFHYFGSQRIANADATDALEQMKHDAIPFLVKWIATVNHSSQGIDYESRALDAFRALGPSASPAIPGLIKVIGRNNNWPAEALFCIGPEAIPALVEALKTNQNPDIYGDWRRGIPANCSREYIVYTLSRYGTNAEAALPLLMQHYRDEAKLSHADMASALASVGHNHPQVVVPALIDFLTNSTGFEEFGAIQGLGSFGKAAQTAIPALLAASQSSDAQIQMRTSVAIKQIAPETPDALAPLIRNLSSETDWLRENALYGLEGLGTNALEARTALLERAQQEKDSQIRVRVMDLLNNLIPNEEEMLPLIKECLANENESVACAGVNSLIPLAEKSQEQYQELLLLAQKHRNSQVRSIAESGVYNIMQRHPEMFMTCLSDGKIEVYLPALKFLHGISHDVVVMDRREPEPSTNFTAYVIRDINEGNKRLLVNAVPIVERRLKDENPEVRKLATNVLLELNPKAARQAGVIVVPPYSFYAN
jgi:HEAT repeat protein